MPHASALYATVRSTHIIKIHLIQLTILLESDPSPDEEDVLGVFGVPTSDKKDAHRSSDFFFSFSSSFSFCSVSICKARSFERSSCSFLSSSASTSSSSCIPPFLFLLLKVRHLASEDHACIVLVYISP